MQALQLKRLSQRQGNKSKMNNALTLGLLTQIQDQQMPHHDSPKRALKPEDIESQQVTRALQDRKIELERQNEAIGRLNEASRLAILARYTEINCADRIETVKLPQIYQRKEAPERDDEAFGLLKNFQKLMQTRLEAQNYAV